MPGPGARARVPQDHDGGTVDLDDLAGVRHVLIFLPGAFTPVCTAEPPGIDALWRRAGERGVPVLAIACDTAPVLAAWRRAEEVDVPPLSDAWPHGAVSKTFDAFDARTGRSCRASLVIDADGRIAWREDASPEVGRDPDRVARALGVLGA